VTLFRGCIRQFKGTRDPEKALQHGRGRAAQTRRVQVGDYMLLTIGEPYGKAGGTNTMKS
jgi:pyruvate kinase